MSDPSSRMRARIPQADPRIFELFDGWLAARGDHPVADRAAFDPVTISRMLAFVWIYRMAPDRGDYICELAGEEVNAVWGNSIKGRTLTEIVGPEHRTTLAGRWARARSEPAILYSATENLPDPHFVHRVERLVLPMRSRDGEVDSVLGTSLYDRRTDRIASGVDTSVAMPAAVLRIPVAEL
ncbi:PAS domain-containing protein [Thalassobaculum salexigens]|uniref:PAS domain-containing protein n=1 Tax=Thalassobaculum salexigens TaxID=455360 RepID=UPI000A0107AE|nr:PAS domain-containing protein [Thalassobaculum salexigens]